MINPVAVHARMLAMMLICILIIEQTRLHFSVAMVPVGALVGVMLVLSIWDVVKYHRIKNDM